MTIYIAAPFDLHTVATHVMQWLESQGHTVTSSWLRGHEGLDDAHARLDLADVARADTLLLINPEGWERSGTGGRHVELGYALRMGKQIVVLGVRSNIFHYLDCVRIIERIEDL